MIGTTTMLRDSLFITIQLCLAGNAWGQVPAAALVPAKPAQAVMVPSQSAAPSAPQSAVIDLRAAIAAGDTGDNGEAAKGDEGGADNGGTLPKGPALSPEQLDDLRREFNSASEAERDSLRAYFKDMGVDIKRLLGEPGEGAAANSGSLAQAVRLVEFTRTPQTVLSARSRLGWGDSARPPAEDFDATAQWLQLQVQAGEWSALAAALAEFKSEDAIAVYSQILQTINRPQRGNPNQRPDPGLLPEEVLALASAAPEVLSDWQVKNLGELLKGAAERYSTAPFLTALSQDVKMFGKQDAAHRERTVKFLIAAGMALDAIDYFPPLDEARAQRDAIALFNYARYHREFAERNRGGDVESHLRTAWILFGDVALIDDAEVELRQQAMQQAIDLLPSMPPSLASAWLSLVFANQELAPAALESIALKAVSLRDSQLDLAQRAQTILTMKESVDTLLGQPEMNAEALRIPLRMLTTALVGEVESALVGGGEQRRGRPQAWLSPEETELLLRAMPNEQWMRAIEPSLASRAYRAAINMAMKANEASVAIDYLANAVARFPDQGEMLADSLLGSWQAHLGGSQQFPDPDMMFVGFVRSDMGAAPLTRGRQRRNLELLSRLLLVLRDVGIDPLTLPSVANTFTACHGRTEVFTRQGIESIFGPIDQIPAAAASRLAEQMRAGLSGDWRDRRAQQAAGMKRTPAELGEMVERGYALAIDLIDRAIALEPSSWRYAVTKAGLTYDRVQYKQSEQKQDFAVYNQYRKEAFEAFAKTAQRYRDLVSAGDQRDDPSVYLAWFSAAVGATELNYLTREDLLVEGSPQDDQIDLIRKAINELPPEIAQRHIGAFAHQLESGVDQLTPEVKPRIVRHAMRIIGAHPAGASLRRLIDLYQDLMKDEIKLRLTIDGDDRVGTGAPFGAVLTLRFTAEVDRETGGFSRYLQNDVWARVGNTYKPMNYRDLMKSGLESSFGDHFTLDAIGFFEALAPPKPVREGGADGWLEKPVAYIVLRANDPSVDRLPPVSIDMHFNDTAGPVVLPIQSNSPPIDAAHSAGIRPVANLEVAQSLDLRDLDAARDGATVTLEVMAKGDGIVPELEVLLPGYATALPGYEARADSIEKRPSTIVAPDDAASAMGMYSNRGTNEPKAYVEPDASGTYRLPSERSWLLTYKPTGSAVGGAFVLPTLRDGLGGKLISRQFADMDLVEVKESSVAITPHPLSTRNLIALAVAVGFVVGMVVLWSRRRKVLATEEREPLTSRVTPISVITALRRVSDRGRGRFSETQQAELHADIIRLERIYFARGDAADGGGQQSANGDGQQHSTNGAAHSDLKSALERWAQLSE